MFYIIVKMLCLEGLLRLCIRCLGVNTGVRSSGSSEVTYPAKKIKYVSYPGIYI